MMDINMQMNANDSLSLNPSPASGRGEGEGWFQRHQRTVWITLIAAAVAVSGVLGYILFFPEKPAGPTYEGDARLTLTMPEATASGAEVSVRADIENLSNTRLTGLALEIFYPQDFSFLDSTPDDTTGVGRSFALPDMEVGGKQHVVVVGRLAGSLQEIKTVSAKLRYIPQNFRSTFLAEAQGSTEIRSSELELQLFAPTHLVSGQSLTYRVEVKNVSVRDYQDLKAVFHYPPKFTGDDPEKVIGSLPSGQSKTVEVAGRLAADPGTEALVEASLVSESGGESIFLARSFAFTRMEASPLSLTHERTAPESVISLGSELDYKVRYENQGQTALRNVTIAVVFTSPASGLLIDSRTGQLKGSTLIWTPAAQSQLLAVAPGQKGEFEFHVRVSEAVAAAIIKNPVVTTRVEYRAAEVPETIAGNSLVYKVRTALGVSATATPLGGDVYQIDLRVTNTVNDVHEAELTAQIPGTDAVVEQQGFDFNPATGMFTWRLGEIFAYSGSFHDARALSFRLTTSNQELMRNIQVRGRDQFVEEDIESNKINTLGTGN